MNFPNPLVLLINPDVGKIPHVGLFIVLSENRASRVLSVEPFIGKNRARLHQLAQGSRLYRLAKLIRACQWSLTRKIITSFPDHPVYQKSIFREPYRDVGRSLSPQLSREDPLANRGIPLQPPGEAREVRPVDLARQLSRLGPLHLVGKADGFQEPDGQVGQVYFPPAVLESRRPWPGVVVVVPPFTVG